MTDIEKGRELFKKGHQEYHNKNWEEALKYFVQSTKYYAEESTDVYISSCKKHIKSKTTQEKTQTAPAPEEEVKATPEQDQECQAVLRKKCYYEILGVSKTATDEEIKRAYKKLAIKFHPDKNQSKFADEAFKKISHSFTTFKDPEKKQFYDKYGPEEEVREKYHQQQQHYYEGEDIDPFDLFEMFFTGGANGEFFQRGGRMYRRRRTEEEEHENRQRQQQRNQNPRKMLIMQMLPLLILILFSVVPYLFQTKPYFSFNLDEEYYKKMTTSRNKVDFYVGDSFIKYYKTASAVKDLEPMIEKEYLSILADQCSKLFRYKNELEYKLSYYSRNTEYKKLIENEIRKLDFTPCEKYNRLKNVSFLLNLVYSLIIKLVDKSYIN